MLDPQRLALLKQMAHGIAVQFGPSCEVVIHDLTTGDLAPFGAVRELQHNTALLEVERPRLEECLQRMFGALPVVDLDVKDIPIEEGIAYFYEKAGVSAP